VLEAGGLATFELDLVNQTILDCRARRRLPHSIRACAEADGRQTRSLPSIARRLCGRRRLARANGTENATKIVYHRRAASAECVNAIARNRGLRQFAVRGTDAVRTVATWYALAHNVMRLASSCRRRRTPDESHAPTATT